MRAARGSGTKTRWARRAALALAVGLGAGACQALAGLDGDFRQAPVVASDAGHAADAAPGMCGKTYPDPPSSADTPIQNDLVLAVHSIDLGEGEAEPPGYDLDGICTCVADAGPSCVSSNQHCDAPDGVDSAAASFINQIEFAVGAGNFGSSYFSTKADKGAWSLLLRVQGYNGEADDPSVDVAVFPSPGLGSPPKWDGTDAWPIAPTSVANGDPSMPLYTSNGAYVSDHVLVASLPAVSLTLAGGVSTMTFKLSNGVLTGTLTPIGTTWRITDGVLAGRWREPDIFATLSNYRDTNGQPFCTDGLPYSTAKSAVCHGRDILANPGGVKSLPCDSLSMGLGFHTDVATLGSVASPVQPTPGCPAATDPISDSCAK